MRRLHSTITLLIVLAVVSALDARGTAPGGTPSAARTADIVRASGEAERVTVVGVGCTEAICSRIAIEGHFDGGQTAERIAFGTIDMLTPASRDELSVRMRDGSTRRMAIDANNRVLYVATPDGRTERVDVASLRSMRFVSK